MPSDLVAAAVAAAQVGGDVLRSCFRSASLEVTEKSRNDFVTSADRASERAILAEILRRYPGDRILSEEAGWVGDVSGDREWIVDPLDGTTNFLQGLPIYAISIACREAGETVAAVILEPQSGDLYTAARGSGALLNDRRLAVSNRPSLEAAFVATGFPFRAKPALDSYLELFRRVFLEARSIRRCGAAALDLAHTASGVFDGFFEYRLSAWDIAAGALLIEEAGGRVTDLNGGGDYLRTGNIVAGSAGVHRDLLALAGDVADETRLEDLVPLLTIGADQSC